MNRRAEGAGMFIEEYIYHILAHENPSCPEEDAVEIDFDARLPTEHNLAPPPGHDSASSGVSTVVQDDYIAEGANISPEEEDDDDNDDEQGVSPTERWHAPLSNFPVLHEDPDETHAGAWHDYDHEYAAIQPTMEPGHFYGDQFENAWVPDARANIPVGYNFNEGLGLEYHAGGGYFEDRYGNRTRQ